MKKQHRNGLCECGSGLKYKLCCGKGEPLKGVTLTYLGEERIGLTRRELNLKEYTGYDPKSYYKPVVSESPIIYVLIDESRIDDLHSVSGVVYTNSINDKVHLAESEMLKLSEQFGVDYFHFTEIFGRRKVFKGNEFDFINKYSEILIPLDLVPFSLACSKDEVCKLHKIGDMTDEQIYISLQWQLMFKILMYCLFNYGNEIIVHVQREQENITNDKAILHYENLKGIQDSFPFAHISFYKYYDIFMKTSILKSSVSDLVAYSTSSIENGRRKEKTLAKISNDNYRPILQLTKCFHDYSFLGIRYFDKYSDYVMKNEEYRGTTNDSNE